MGLECKKESLRIVPDRGTRGKLGGPLSDKEALLGQTLTEPQP